MAWGDLATRIQIPDAQFVGAVADGGVVIETHDIEYVEGRMRASADYEHGNDETKHLGFVMDFGTIGALDPDCAVSIAARIVISGTAAAGFVEIRGDGWFGYDEKGNIEGRFDTVPAILVREIEPYAIDAQAEMSEADWLKQMNSTSAKTSAAFEWAARGRFIDTGESVPELDDDRQG